MLTVTYTSPGNQTYSGYGFWDTDATNPGLNVFRIRASFPQPGKWKWQTQWSGGACGSDPAVAPCSGEVDVTASGVNRPPINTQGGLKVSTAAPNPSRYLAHANNVPFYWQGDTAWSGVWRATAADWSRYLDTRKLQGFTVVQVSMPIGSVTGSQTQPLDRSNQKPFVDNGCAGAIPNSCSRWNPAFWREYERKVNEANDKGFVVVIVGLFKRVVEQKDCAEQSWPALAEAKTYARNVVARLAGNHVIFSSGFDGFPRSLSDPLSEADPTCGNTGVNNVNLACRARAIGNVIKASLVRGSDGTPLIGLVTHHIGGGCKAGDSCPTEGCCTSDCWLRRFQQEGWLDLQLFQSGQGLNCASGDFLACLTERARERPKRLYDNAPVKPNVNGEGVYDNFGFRYEPDPLDTGCPKQTKKTADSRYTDTRARQVAYLSALSGALGATLGVAGTWDWGEVTGATLTQALDTALSPVQMKHMCTLFRNLGTLPTSTQPSSEWPKLIPDPVKIAGQTVTTSCDATTADEAKKMVYARDGTMGGGRFALAYLPVSSAGTIDLDTAGLLGFGTSWCRQWFNPRAGTYQNTTATPVTGSTTRYTFSKPDANDWVLVLKDPSLPCWTTPPTYCPCLTASGGLYTCSTTP